MHRTRRAIVIAAAHRLALLGHRLQRRRAGGVRRPPRPTARSTGTTISVPDDHDTIQAAVDAAVTR